MLSHDDIRTRAEALWEELGGDLCLCQHPDVAHWCERCQSRIDLILAAFREAIELHAEANP
jgi:DNA replication protein DnaD